MNKTSLSPLPERLEAVARRREAVRNGLGIPANEYVGQSEIDTIREAARAVREAGAWLPIETAPTDVDPTTKCGPPVLVAEDTYVDLAFYHDGSHCYGHRGEAGWFAADDWGSDRLLTASNPHPTHWQPLPAAPTQDQENGS